MAELKMEEFRRQLKQGEPGRCYLLYGKERYLLEHYARELRRAVLDADDDPFNLRVLENVVLRRIGSSFVFHRFTHIITIIRL